jgi:hypothetical protein
VRSPIGTPTRLCFIVHKEGSWIVTKLRLNGMVTAANSFLVLGLLISSLRTLWAASIGRMGIYEIKGYRGFCDWRWDRYR